MGVGREPPPRVRYPTPPGRRHSFERSGLGTEALGYRQRGDAGRDAGRPSRFESRGGRERAVGRSQKRAEGVAMPVLEDLKAKYQSVIDLAKERGVHLKNVHLENDKLLIRGDAPNQAIKNEVWDRIKVVDPKYADLTADIGIDQALPVPPRMYEVVAGDTLSKIAKAFYGDAKQYMKIFDANKDQLKDPDKIKVGQKLKIPS
jgi:nucleoid-associated protein YgaU